MASITLDQISFSYPGTKEPVLKDLSLQIEDGTTHALLGASGAGKTTLLNLLSGLLTPSSGDLRFGDKCVSAVGARGRNVALVFQFPVLYETKTVLENLVFPLLNRGWKEKEARSRAYEVAQELELADVLQKRPADLSLYQKQLAAIAKSLVRTDVDLVLLDEPLTAVEPAMKWRLRQRLSRFQAEHGLTMIYVTHDQTEALTFASQVSVLSNGRILQTGTPEEIYNHPVDRFVGDFIGSPGMRFLPTSRLNSDPSRLGLSFSQPPETGTSTFLGLRAEWLTPQRSAHGIWELVSKRLLGTDGGQEKSLLAFHSGDLELLVEGLGTWREGDRANLTVSRYALLPAETTAIASV
ncbi:MAG: ABC transporter ATP-binding protein [Pseudomonadota bacterium]